ncbi:MAG: glycosyl transferase, partial [Chitinophagaceae bacterium]
MTMNNLKDGGPSYRWLQVLIALAVFANLSPIFITVLGPDGALYASISKTMAISNDYVNLIAEGRDWLDKPHFPFWVTAFSFEIFGVHGWSYKLPGLCFLMVGAWYTYLYGWKLYNKQTGLVAAVILLTAEHILL